MQFTQLDPLGSSLVSLTAIASLLIAGLAVAVAFLGNYPELYFIAALTGFFCGLVLPYLIWRMIQRLHVARELHEVLRPASGLVIGALSIVFALAVAYRINGALRLHGNIAILALTVMLAIMLIGFLMLAVRHEAVSQIIGLLVLDNGIRVGAQILIPGMPLLIELMVLFDVLVVVACFGILVRYLMTHAGTTSSLELKRRVG